MTKRETVVARDGYCLNISEDVFMRWSNIGKIKSHISDSQTASFLLDIYDLHHSARVQIENELSVHCDHCQAPLSLSCFKCQTVSHRTLRQGASDGPLISKYYQTAQFASASEGGKMCSGCGQKAFDHQAEELVSAGSPTFISDNAESISTETAADLGNLGESSSCVWSSKYNDGVTERQIKRSGSVRQGKRIPRDTASNPTLNDALEKRKEQKILHKSFAGEVKTQTNVSIKKAKSPKLLLPNSGSLDTCTENIFTDNMPETVSLNGRYPCSVCNVSLGCLNRLKTHYRRAHTCERPYSCKFCKESFAELFQMKRHINNKHIGLRPHACDTCGKAFFDKSTLKRHVLRSHTQERSHVCRMCRSAFFERSDLSKHVQQHHVSKETQSGLKETKPKPFLCSDCGVGFSHKSSLVTHMHKHSGTKPYSCSGCGNAFRAKSTLRYHMRIHTDDRRFVCELCGEKYITKSALTVHRRKHAGEKPFVCDGCSKGFYISGDLKKHRNSCVRIVAQRL